MPRANEEQFDEASAWALEPRPGAMQSAATLTGPPPMRVNFSTEPELRRP